MIAEQPTKNHFRTLREGLHRQAYEYLSYKCIDNIVDCNSASHSKKRTKNSIKTKRPHSLQNRRCKTLQDFAKPDGEYCAIFQIRNSPPPKKKPTKNAAATYTMVSTDCLGKYKRSWPVVWIPVLSLKRCNILLAAVEGECPPKKRHKGE